MTEGLRRTPEFQIGDRVPIKEHFCSHRRPQAFGRITEIKPSGQPYRAECDRCHERVPIDFKALGLKNPPRSRRK